MLRKLLLNNKGQNVIEYLLIIAVLALGIVVGGKYIRNVLRHRTDAARYGQNYVRTDTNSYYVVNADRKTEITRFTKGEDDAASDFGKEEKQAWDDW